MEKNKKIKLLKKNSSTKLGIKEFFQYYNKPKAIRENSLTSKIRHRKRISSFTNISGALEILTLKPEQWQKQ